MQVLIKSTVKQSKSYLDFAVSANKLRNSISKIQDSNSEFEFEFQFP